MAKELTPAQLKQREERAARAAAPIEKANAGDAGQEPDAVSLSVALGEGEKILLGDREMTVAPFPIARLNEGYAKIYSCNALLLALALAVPEGQEIDVQTVTDHYNVICGREESGDPTPFTADQVSISVSALSSILGQEEQMAPIFEAILFALKRRHPDVTRKDLEDEVDVLWFIRIVRIIIRVNSGMRASF